MTMKKLTAAQLAAHRSSGGRLEYVKFLKGLDVGEGGRTTVEEEGVSRQTIKNRLTKSADAAGVSIKFVRASSDAVVFKVVGE